MESVSSGDSASVNSTAAVASMEVACCSGLDGVSVSTSLVGVAASCSRYEFL